MSGRNSLWLPGLDHASIATQSIVEKTLLKKGIKREELGRIFQHLCTASTPANIVYIQLIVSKFVNPQFNKCVNWIGNIKAFG